MNYPYTNGPQGPKPKGYRMFKKEKNRESFQLKDLMIESSVERTSLEEADLPDLYLDLFMGLREQLTEKIKENMQMAKVDGKMVIRCRLGILPLKGYQD